MKRLLGLLVSLWMASGVWAGQERVSGPADEPLAVQCGWLMTERECGDHQRILFELTDPQARQAYLNLLEELMRERSAACSCRPELQSRTRWLRR